MRTKKNNKAWDGSRPKAASVVAVTPIVVAAGVVVGAVVGAAVVVGAGVGAAVEVGAGVGAAVVVEPLSFLYQSPITVYALV